jgi:hypothetical protein
MSRQFRHRATGVALAALFAVAPLLTTGSAHAEQSGNGREVVFGGGGVLGFSCAAQPNVEALRVPSGSTIRVINRTGHRAKLRLNGDSQGGLADDGATEVVFRRGTVAVSLEPDCVLRDASTPAIVTASPSVEPSESTPEPLPSSVPPVASDSATPPTTSTPPASSPSASSGSPNGSPSLPGSPAGVPHRPSQAGTTTRHGTSVATTATHSMPQGGSTTSLDTATTATGTSAATPTFAGMPPGDDATVVPGVPSVDVPASDAVTSSSPSAAEPVAALKPLDGPGPDGLLVVIATICVLGVTAGAIRAFVAQRASGTSRA